MFTEKNNKFAIRKLTVGVASVLIGVAFFMTSGNAQAAENDKGGTTEQPKTEEVTKDVKSENTISDPDVAKAKEDLEKLPYANVGQETSGVNVFHKTSGDSANAAAGATPELPVIIGKKNRQKQIFIYKLEGNKYVLMYGKNALGDNGEVIPDQFDSSDITMIWRKGYEPDTNVKKFSDESKKDKPGFGTETSFAKDNANYDPKAIQKDKNGQGVTQAYEVINDELGGIIGFGGTNDPNSANYQYCDYYGAKAGESKDLTVGDQVTDETAKSYLDPASIAELEEAGKQGNWTVDSYTWVKKPDTSKASDNAEAIVRINFTDNGKTKSYLDIPVSYIVKNVTPSETPNEPAADQPAQPTKPTQPADNQTTPVPAPVLPEIKDDETPVDDNEIKDDETPVDDNSEEIAPVKSQTTVKHSKKVSTSKNVSAKNNAVKASATNNASVKEGVKAELPQTGEKKSEMGIFGLAIAAMASMLGLASDRKRNK